MKRFIVPLLVLLIIGIVASRNAFTNTLSSTRMSAEVDRVTGQPASALLLQTSAESSSIAAMNIAAPAAMEAPAAEGSSPVN